MQEKEAGLRAYIVNVGLQSQSRSLVAHNMRRNAATRHMCAHTTPGRRCGGGGDESLCTCSSFVVLEKVVHVWDPVFTGNRYLPHFLMKSGSYFGFPQGPIPVQAPAPVPVTGTGPGPGAGTGQCTTLHKR